MAAHCHPPTPHQDGTVGGQQPGTGMSCQPAPARLQSARHRSPPRAGTAGTEAAGRAGGWSPLASAAPAGPAAPPERGSSSPSTADTGRSDPTRRCGAGSLSRPTPVPRLLHSTVVPAASARGLLRCRRHPGPSPLTGLLSSPFLRVAASLSPTRPLPCCSSAGFPRDVCSAACGAK